MGGHWPTNVLQWRWPASQSVVAAMYAIAAEYQADWGMPSCMPRPLNYWAVASAASEGGSKTVSITWMTPLVAMMSGVVTVASLT